MRRFIRHRLAYSNVRKLAVRATRCPLILIAPAMAVACATAQQVTTSTERFPVELDTYIAKVLAD
jgi:hypothetical protein